MPYSNHAPRLLTVAGGIPLAELDQLDRTAAAAGISRAAWIGHAVVRHANQFDQLARRCERLDRRPNAERRVTVAGTVSRDLLAQLRAAARAANMPISRIVALAIADALTACGADDDQPTLIESNDGARSSGPAAHRSSTAKPAPFVRKETATGG